MKTSSPLRYPGGKSAMTGLLSQIRKLNGLGNRAIAEPFAGGAGASLNLLFLEETNVIYINDADPAIYDFWWCLVNRPKLFLNMMAMTPVSIDEWHRQRSIYNAGARVSRMRRGFSAFYLNRCNRSGIIVSGGPIGGIEQVGKWKLDARFNKIELSRRCEKVAEYGDRICVSGLDGLKLIDNLASTEIFFFIDPPYFIKGGSLYLNALEDNYHLSLANRLNSMQDAAWVLTYDDCREIRRLYEDWATIRPFTLCYTASNQKNGKEILIAPKWMRLPRHQTSMAIAW